jgi:molybdopterin/thiamine biosynthesis adenylyltransferase
MNSLGLEIAKNIILSGVKTITLVDYQKIQKSDLASNFYANEDCIGKNRAIAVQQKLAQLNCYVKVIA